MEEKCIHDLEGEPERTRPYERPMCRWGYNIKVDLKYSVGKDMTYWFGSQQGQAGASCKLGNQTSGSTNFGEFLD
jgi:hypothetical protein